MAHPSVIINGVTYPSVPQVEIPKSTSGTAVFYDASDTDVSASDLRNGVTCIGASGEIVGTLADNGATGGTISTKAGTVTIPAGITTGGSVSLLASAVTDCVASNILNGKSILGISGTLAMPSISQNSSTHVLSIS